MAGGYNIQRHPLKKEHLRGSESGVLYPLVRGIILYYIVWDKTKYREVSIYLRGSFFRVLYKRFQTNLRVIQEHEPAY
jgi:hypothetical protein